MDDEENVRASELFRMGPRHVLAWVDASGAQRRRLFVNRWDLAIALRSLRDPAAAKAWGSNGKRIDVGSLLRTGRALSKSRRKRAFEFGMSRYYWVGDAGTRAGHQTRWGPVPGISMRRGGRCHRRIGTQHERVWAQSVDRDEPAPRARRGPSMLPNAWDDLPLRRENGWKRQRQGKKAWARAGCEPAGDRRAMADWLNELAWEESEGDFEFDWTRAPIAR